MFGKLRPRRRREWFLHQGRIRALVKRFGETYRPGRWRIDASSLVVLNDMVEAMVERACYRAQANPSRSHDFQKRVKRRIRVRKHDV